MEEDTENIGLWANFSKSRGGHGKAVSLSWVAVRPQLYDIGKNGLGELPSP